MARLILLLTYSLTVTEITGYDVEGYVEVVHSGSHENLKGWLRRGVFCGQPRFHFSKKFDIITR
jgi:hypothetical protein